MSKRLDPSKHKPGSVIKRFRTKDSDIGVDIVAGETEFCFQAGRNIKHVDFRIKFLDGISTHDFFSEGHDSGDILFTGELVNQLIRARTWCKANLKQDPMHPHGFIR